MKKIACSLAIILLLSVPLAVYAESPRISTIYPALSFSNNTATCSVIISTDDPSGKITATVKLWNGNHCLRIWSGLTGTNYLDWSDTTRAIPGYTYTLTVDAVIGGVPVDQVSVSRAYE